MRHNDYMIAVLCSIHACASLEWRYLTNIDQQSRDFLLDLHSFIETICYANATKIHRPNRLNYATRKYTCENRDVFEAEKEDV